jgi:DNA-binding response OmpR family regulator
VNILLTEDDINIRLIVEDALTSAGYTVDVTATAADALSLLDVQRYDLLLTDGQLPDGTGLMVAQKATRKGTKVLLFTGAADTCPGDPLSMYPVMMKSAKMQDVVQAVARIFDH